MNVCLKYTLTPPVSASLSASVTAGDMMGAQWPLRSERGERAGWFENIKTSMSGLGSDWSFMRLKHPVCAPVKSL